MQNEHLIPQIVMDLVAKAIDPNIRLNEKQNYIHRLEVIRDYCNATLETNKFSKKNVSR